MIGQILFLFTLYVFGVGIGLLFRRQLPLALIGLTGFLWGALVWVVGGILLLMFSIPYTPLSMLVIFFLLSLGAGFLQARNQIGFISRQELGILLPLAGGFLLTILLASQFNFSYVSSDSINQLITGRRIAIEGLSSGVIEELSLRGVFLSQLQSASVFLNVGYLAALQPAFGMSFIALFFYLSHRILSHLLSNQRLARVLAILGGLALFSTYFLVFQFFYIHNSLISAVYLFLGVSCFWLAGSEENRSWMIPGMMALLGFSLARTEAPLFALVFLALVISADQISYRDRLRFIMPILALIIFWYTYLLVRMGPGTKILDPEKTLVIILALAAGGVLVLLSELKWIKRFLLPHIPHIMLGVLAALLVFMAIQRTGHMKGSLYVSLLNILRYGRWGLTWLVFSQLLLVSLLGPRLPGEKLFFSGIFSFLGLLLAIVYFRNPYRIGWYDSANRMLTHILPVVVLYVLMKAAQGLPSRNV